ncbi:hypothetical protein TRFO_30735 [Tritrichomonas foetus]|uniref:Protein kinase domain-containing protein n=1 Tax=Tritrichomonas foetus TaxID=1144522 RepID=A0A1J4JUV9_9EUKA|nr:hypothetical protein TRFO_30735 [Tritrichomonas foetus]|eukprot:OHT02224.1 hypothetical protein TRFO_30735 [Tritrichomonas foetus]
MIRCNYSNETYDILKDHTIQNLFRIFQIYFCQKIDDRIMKYLLKKIKNNPFLVISQETKCNNDYIVVCIESVCIIFDTNNDENEKKQILSTIFNKFHGIIYPRNIDISLYLSGSNDSSTCSKYNIQQHLEQMKIETKNFFNFFINYMPNINEEKTTAEILKIILFHVVIQTLMTYSIRRFYFPTSSFKDPSFFHSFSHLATKVYTEFKQDDFIFLRNIHSSSRSELNLYMHKKTLYLVTIKERRIENLTQEQISFDDYYFSNYNYEFVNKCYGFFQNPKIENPVSNEIIPNNNKYLNNYIYEFMSNGNLEDVITFLSEKEKHETIFRSIICLIFIHKCDIIHGNINPKKLLFNHDFLSFFADFDTNSPNINIASFDPNNFNHFLSPEQHFCQSCQGNNINKIESSTDIYSFGLLIYYIYEGKDLIQQIMTNGNFGYSRYQTKTNENKHNYKKNYKSLFQLAVKCLPNRLTHVKDILEQCLKYDSICRPTADVLMESFGFKNKSIILKYQSFTSSQEMLELNGEKSYSAYIQCCQDHYISEAKNILDMMKNFANENDQYSLQLLGEIYYYGLWIDKDYDTAIYYFTLSSRQNNKNANFKLFILYSDEELKYYDINKTKHYLELACRYNSIPAHCEIAKLYLSGNIYPKNINNAIYHGDFVLNYLDTLSEEESDTIDKNDLNLYHEFIELILCHLYIIKNQNYDYNNIYNHYYEVYAKFNPSEISSLGYLYELENDKRAISCLKIGIEQYNHYQNYILFGIIYSEGQLCPKNLVMSAICFAKAAIHNFDRKLNWMSMYFPGEMLTKNQKDDLFINILYKKGSKEMLFLGEIFLNGYFVEQNLNMALKIFLDTIVLDNPETSFQANYFLSMIYLFSIDHLNIKKAKTLILNLISIKDVPNEHKYRYFIFLGLISKFYENNYMDALNYFNKAKKASPLQLESYCNIGYLFESSMNTENSIIHFQRASDLFDNYLKSKLTSCSFIIKEFFFDTDVYDERFYLMTIINLKLYLFFYLKHDEMNSSLYFQRIFDCYGDHYLGQQKSPYSEQLETVMTTIKNAQNMNINELKCIIANNEEVIFRKPYNILAIIGSLSQQIPINNSFYLGFDAN